MNGDDVDAILVPNVEFFEAFSDEGLGSFDLDEAVARREEDLLVYFRSKKFLGHIFARLFLDDDNFVSPDEFEDVDIVIPHQNSGPGVDAVARYGFDMDKIVKTVGEEGNCVAASIPLGLARAHREGRLERGDLVVICGTGAGLSVLAMLLRW